MDLDFDRLFNLETLCTPKVLSEHPTTAKYPFHCGISFSADLVIPFFFFHFL